MTDPTDVIVIGGGAGGLTAANQATRRGASVTLVADGPLGGDCTHTGCVPSKALIAAGARGDDFATAMATVRAAVTTIAATEDEAHLERAGIRVIRSRAVLADGGRVTVDGTSLTAPHIIVATGARASLPPVPGLAALTPLTNETVFSLEQQPESMIVIGAGPIGCELSQAFARLGTTVTIVDVASRVLPNEDPDASAVIAAALAAQGIGLHLGVGIDRADTERLRCRLHLADGTVLDASTVLVAAGRKAVTDGLGAGEVGIHLDGAGRIVVDDTCATSVAGIWAVGDVTDHGGFTHVAGHMAYVAARNATRTRRSSPRTKLNTRVVPRVTFTDPEVAHVGLTEHEAAAHGARVAQLPLERVDRAITSVRTDGFVKLISGPRKVLGNAGGGELLGATIVATRAGELIHEAVLAMQTRMFTGRLAQTTHAYPTWSMAIQQAATQFYFPTDGLEARPARRQS